LAEFYPSTYASTYTFPGNQPQSGVVTSNPGGEATKFQILFQSVTVQRIRKRPRRQVKKAS
jgi:hypothetical protein